MLKVKQKTENDGRLTKTFVFLFLLFLVFFFKPLMHPSTMELCCNWTDGVNSVCKCVCVWRLK